jgi:hypothetical protein
MTLCLSCHQSNPDESKFCTVCGSKLDQGLAQFLSSHGLHEHLGALQRHDLLSLQDVLALGDEDFRELALPYGDLVRLKNAVQELRVGDHVTTSPTEREPPSQLPIQPAASSLPPQSRSGTGKLLAGVVLTLAAAAACIVLVWPTAKQVSDSSLGSAGQAVRNAEKRALQAERELALLRGQPASPEALPTPSFPKLKAFDNSLGHRMVPIPGTSALFSIWPARVSDYSLYVAATGTPWKAAGFPQGPNHPAVRVNYHNARAFCDWLTRKELQAGLIPPGYEYRLPRDLEWSSAAGLSENPEGPPAWRSGAIADCFPWGSSWPPPQGSGNYDSRLRADSFPYTSPVGSFAPNKNGLYDLSGNVFEWVEDDFDESGLGCLRGGSWPDESPVNLNLSTRCQDNKTTAHKCYGFRFVLAPESE